MTNKQRNIIMRFMTVRQHREFQRTLRKWRAEYAQHK